MSVKRIIPWALPPIAGGSQGGYTPRPGPTPTPTDPYDFSEMEFSLDFTDLYFGNIPSSGTQDAHSPITVDMKGIVATVSGIKINDVSEVGSVVLLVLSDADDTTYTWASSVVESGMSGSKEDLSIGFDITSIASLVGGESNNTPLNTGFTFSNGGWITGTSRKYSVAFADPKYYIRVYNPNGAIIQEQELTIEEDEGEDE